jgi:hypothetical protein
MDAAERRVSLIDNVSNRVWALKFFSQEARASAAPTRRRCSALGPSPGTRMKNGGSRAADLALPSGACTRSQALHGGARAGV